MYTRGREKKIDNAEENETGSAFRFWLVFFFLCIYTNTTQVQRCHLLPLFESAVAL